MADLRGAIFGGGAVLNQNPAIGTSLDIFQNTNWVEYLMQCPEPATLTKMGFCVASVGTPPIYKGSIYNINSSGRADIAGGALATGTVTPGAGWNEVTFGTPLTVTRGQEIALAVEYSSGTLDASHHAVINPYISNWPGAFPAAWTVSASVGTFRDARPLVAITDGTHYWGWPMISVNTSACASYSSDTAPNNEFGLRFKYPASAFSTQQVAGIQWAGRVGAVSKTVTVHMTGDSTGASFTATGTLHTSNQGTDAGGNRVQTVLFTTNPLPTISANTVYYVSILPTQTATTIGISSMDVSSNAHLDAYPGGSEFYLCTRSGGAYSTVTTTRPMIDLILADTTSAAGGLLHSLGYSGGTN